MQATILIVDDEKDNRKILEDFLKRAEEGFELIQTPNGAKAYEKAVERQPDLILMDWNMPVMDGITALKKLKADELTKAIPVIMQTAETEDYKLKEAFESGALDYIKKPISELELLARVRSAIALNRAQKQTEALLLNILPKEVAEELKVKGRVTPKIYEKVSILFTDFKGFSRICESINPEELLEELDNIFQSFDEIVSKYNLERIKTIGDAYMAVGGLPQENKTNPIDAVNAGLEIQAFMQRYREDNINKGKSYFQCRLGVHTGRVIAGVVGKTKFAYDIWGKDVNVASRIESNGEVGKVSVSEATYQEIKVFFDCTHRGKIEAKNIGMIDAYFVNGILPELSIHREGIKPNEMFWELHEKKI